MARSPIFVATNVQNGTLDSAFCEIRINSGIQDRTLGGFGNDPITYTLQANGVNNCVYFEISELIRDYITLNFIDSSNISDSNYDNLSGGFFRYPTRPIYATVDVRFKRTVNGSQQGYFTDSVVGQLCTLGYTKYEFGPQWLNAPYGFIGYPTFLRRESYDIDNDNKLENWQLYQTPDRPLLASNRIVKPIWAPVEFTAARPWINNISGSLNDSAYFGYSKGNIKAIYKNTSASSSSDQLAFIRLASLWNSQNYASNIKDLSEWPQWTDLGDPKFQYLYTDSEQLKKYLDSPQNNDMEIDSVYYNMELNKQFDLENTLRTCIKVENRSCSGYEPMKITFLNRYGVYEVIWYFKNHKESINVRSTKFKRNIIEAYQMAGYSEVQPTYNIANHQNFTLDKTATKTIVLNSDWYPEYMNNSFEDILLSTHVWLEYKTQVYPVVVKDTSFTYKTSKTDGLINHKLTVELANDYINNIS